MALLTSGSLIVTRLLSVSINLLDCCCWASLPCRNPANNQLYFANWQPT